MLRRAAELTPQVGSDGEVELSAENLLEVAEQAGIAPEAVLAALAEDRVEANGEIGLLDRIVGPRRVWGTRIVDYRDSEVALTRWLQSGHGLRTWIRPDGVIMATPQRSLAGKVSGAVRRAAGSQGQLHQANNVQAVTVEVADGPGAVCAVVDVGNRRSEAVIAGSVVTSASITVIALGSVLAGPLAWLGVPVVAGFATLGTRFGYSRTVRRMRGELERTLDGVAVNEDPPSLRGALAEKVPWFGS